MGEISHRGLTHGVEGPYPAAQGAGHAGAACGHGIEDIACLAVEVEVQPQEQDHVNGRRQRLIDPAEEEME